MSIPAVTASLDSARAIGAARYLTGRMALARGYAVRRSTNVALRFNWDGRDASIQMFADGNGNGVRTSEVASGVDPAIERAVTLSSLFPAVVIGAPGGANPVRLGPSGLLSFTPLGTATSGSIYVKGEGLQLAIRIFGATGRTRIERYEASRGVWVTSF